MKLTVNGEPMEMPEGSHLKSLLEKLDLKPELVVVELNLKILKREELAQTVLKESDQVEIVHFVGGGCVDVARRTGQAGVRGAGLTGRAGKVSLDDQNGWDERGRCKSPAARWAAGRTAERIPAGPVRPLPASGPEKPRAFARPKEDRCGK